MRFIEARARSAALVLTLVGLTACMGQDQLEVRTFALQYLEAQEAIQMIDPYVYGDREGAPGTVSVTTGVLTVRETKDNLDKIERVLAEFDLSRAFFSLRFQLIEADGFTDSDPRIAAVEEQLRKLFQFRGYRLAGEGFVSASDHSQVTQAIQGTDDLYEVSSTVFWTGPSMIRLQNVSLYAEKTGQALSTTVNIRPGQTLVLGSSPKAGSTATLLLTVRAELIDGGS